jgi:hypothetical protein
MYFYAIKTTAFQPDFDKAANNHNNALNNYLKYGVASELSDFAMRSKMPPLAKEKHINHVAGTVQNVLNGNIITTTWLCCDDD